MNFQKAYNSLNPAQKQAVDQVYGPVLVVAGPGTGKTQLLALRVANILNKTDADARSILCLTFTDSAQITMQERLVSFIGESAYKVAVHTFHSFAAEVISHNSEFFDQSVASSVADALTSYEILHAIFEKLPYGNPLIVRDGDAFVYLSDVRSRISHFKKAGLSADEVREVVARDKKWIASVEPKLAELMQEIKPMSMKRLPVFHQMLDLFQSFGEEDSQLHGFKSLSGYAVTTLKEAIEQAETTKKSTALTAWKNNWLVATQSGGRMKYGDYLKKIESTADIYESYQEVLMKRHLRDFDDLILSVIDCLESHPDLKAKLQEQYQFLLVDEYQDTNGSQQQLIELLAENPVTEDSPNLMVVGDDDQAIYGFQGANPEYMTAFTRRWSGVTEVTLTDNYRSTPQILNFAKEIITQAPYRKTTNDILVSKDLTAVKKSDGKTPLLREYSHSVEQFWGIAKEIKQRINQGQSGASIAIIAPRHQMLESIVPYLLRTDIPVNYERRDNILQQRHIRELLLLARTVCALADDDSRAADSYLPELLSAEFWNLDPVVLWELQLSERGTSWLERMMKNETLTPIAEFLIAAAAKSRLEPLEVMMDILVGNETLNDVIVSPFHDFYFQSQQLEDSPINYLSLLSSLSVLRSKVLTYHPDQIIYLRDLLSYVQLAERANENITDTHPITIGEDGVQLLTSHKSKGQEYSTVFILNADQVNWVTKKGRSNLIGLPPNLPIEPNPADEPEKLRQFYVSITRAADELILTRSTSDNNGKKLLPLSWMTAMSVEEVMSIDNTSETSKSLTTEELIQGLRFDWRQQHSQLIRTQPKLKAILKEKLSLYHLSASHLTHFLDLEYGGPDSWLINQLLAFPRQTSRDAHFGIAIHSILEQQHQLVSRGQKVSVDKAVSDLTIAISSARLSELDRNHLNTRGEQALRAYLAFAKDSFSATQRSEYKVPHNQVSIDGVRLHGTADLLDINTTDKTIRVIDYKTGRSFDTWKPEGSNHQLKLQRYRQQLMFYKLLIENSREFSDYTVTHGELHFVEPDENGRINILATEFSSDETAQFTDLLKAVWKSMINLNLPRTDDLPGGKKGQFMFEKRIFEI